MLDADADDSGKADGAMLAIGELAARIGVPTHVLRYWETRFPDLKPLQRSGRRRYYRAGDVALAERIHHLLHERGFTVEGARRALTQPGMATGETRVPPTREQLDSPVESIASPAAAPTNKWQEPSVPLHALIDLRQRLAAALDAPV